jgi:hypothetical protein
MESCCSSCACWAIVGVVFGGSVTGDGATGLEFGTFAAGGGGGVCCWVWAKAGETIQARRNAAVSRCWRDDPVTMR